MERQKYINTLKMMGVSYKDSLFFVDSMSTYHLCINPVVKTKLLETISNTIIQGKTFKEWFYYFLKKYPLYENRFDEITKSYRDMPINIETISFDIKTISLANILSNFDLILNEYYINVGYTQK